jgi:hypothetical protein
MIQIKNGSDIYLIWIGHQCAIKAPGQKYILDSANVALYLVSFPRSTSVPTNAGRSIFHSMDPYGVLNMAKGTGIDTIVIALKNGIAQQYDMFSFSIVPGLKSPLADSFGSRNKSDILQILDINTNGPRDRIDYYVLTLKYDWKSAPAKTPSELEYRGIAIVISGVQELVKQIYPESIPVAAAPTKSVQDTNIPAPFPTQNPGDTAERYARPVINRKCFVDKLNKFKCDSVDMLEVGCRSNVRHKRSRSKS